MKDINIHHKLEPNTNDLVGYAFALHTSDKYFDEPAYDTIKKM